jgi:hypothetical protein
MNNDEGQYLYFSESEKFEKFCENIIFFSLFLSSPLREDQGSSHLDKTFFHCYPLERLKCPLDEKRAPRHFVNLSFGQLSNLPTWCFKILYNCHFVNLLFYFLYNCHLVNVSFGQLAILSSRHFVTLSTCHFICVCVCVCGVGWGMGGWGAWVGVFVCKITRFSNTHFSIDI